MSDTETVTITPADVVTVQAEDILGCTGQSRNLLGCACPFCQKNPAEGAVAVFTAPCPEEPSESDAGTDESAE